MVLSTLMGSKISIGIFGGGVSMLYTLGHKESYTRYFKEQERVIKLGRNRSDGYPGGSVWRTEAEARKYCSEGYDVYGVLAEWEVDTEPSKQGDWHDLLINAELVQLESVETV